jgi:hypothetical protein
VALIIEDGSNVAGANSYCDLATIRAYALARGVTLSAVDDSLNAHALKAMDYIEALRKQFQGCKSNYPGDDGSLPVPQPLQWPRRGVLIDNYPVEFNVIPQELKNAQCQLCIELFNDVDLMPTQTGQFVLREKVGSLETQYSETIGTSGPTLSKVDSLLSILFKDDSGFALTTVRI